MSFDGLSTPLVADACLRLRGDVLERYASLGLGIPHPSDTPGGLYPFTRARQLKSYFPELVFNQHQRRLQRQSSFADVQQNSAVALTELHIHHRFQLAARVRPCFG